MNTLKFALSGPGVGQRTDYRISVLLIKVFTNHEEKTSTNTLHSPSAVNSVSSTAQTRGDPVHVRQEWEGTQHNP